MLSYIANIFPDNVVSGNLSMFWRKFMADTPEFSSVYFFKYIPGKINLSVNITNIKLMPGLRLLKNTSNSISDNTIEKLNNMLSEVGETLFKEKKSEFAIGFSKWFQTNITYGE